MKVENMEKENQPSEIILELINRKDKLNSIPENLECEKTIEEVNTQVDFVDKNHFEIQEASGGVDRSKCLGAISGLCNSFALVLCKLLHNRINEMGNIIERNSEKEVSELTRNIFKWHFIFDALYLLLSKSKKNQDPNSIPEAALYALKCAWILMLRCRTFTKFEFEISTYKHNVNNIVGNAIQKNELKGWIPVDMASTNRKKFIHLDQETVATIVASSPCRECPVCYTTEFTQDTNFAILDSCRHLLCLTCADSLFTVRISNQRVAPREIYCPYCRAKIEVWTTSVFFQKRIMMRKKERKAERRMKRKEMRKQKQFQTEIFEGLNNP